jgi:hypothetical protein
MEEHGMAGLLGRVNLHRFESALVIAAALAVLAVVAVQDHGNAQDEALDNDRALVVAAGDGDLSAVRSLLREGASVRYADDAGVTALIAASYPNHIEVADVLIDAGADVNAQDDSQQSAYLIATSEGYLDLLRLTLQPRADVRSTDSFDGTGLIRAAERGHVDVVVDLLETEIDVDHVNRLGLTALLEAIMFGDGGERHTEVVRLLVGAGADVNLADGDGTTPLAHARQRGFETIAGILERAGAR